MVGNREETCVMWLYHEEQIKGPIVHLRGTD